MQRAASLVHFPALCLQAGHWGIIWFLLFRHKEDIERDTFISVMLNTQTLTLNNVNNNIEQN